MSQTLAQYQSQANPADWALATQYANQYGIPSNIYLALIAHESSWNPAAQSPNSSSYGYTQLTSGTAEQLGVDSHSVSGNLQGGAEYLAEMFKKFGNWTDALAHYNQGPNATSQTALAAGAQYANAVMSIANTAPSTSAAAPAPTNGGAAPAPSSAAGAPAGGTDGAPSWVSQILSWVKSQLGSVLFIIIGGALIIIALLHNDTVREGAATVVKTAAVA